MSHNKVIYKKEENLVSSKVTTMERMFNYCISLSSLETSNWDTSNVSIMTGIFYGCKLLNSLDLSSLNTSNVRSLSCMFKYCTRLTSTITIRKSSMLDIYYSDMFDSCSISTASKFTVNYTAGCQALAQNMVSTKISWGNVVLGTQVS